MIISREGRNFTGRVNNRQENKKNANANAKKGKIIQEEKIQDCRREKWELEYKKPKILKTIMQSYKKKESKKR